MINHKNYAFISQVMKTSTDRIQKGTFANKNYTRTRTRTRLRCFKYKMETCTCKKCARTLTRCRSQPLCSKNKHKAPCVDIFLHPRCKKKYRYVNNRHHYVNYVHMRLIFPMFNKIMVACDKNLSTRKVILLTNDLYLNHVACQHKYAARRYKEFACWHRYTRCWHDIYAACRRQKYTTIISRSGFMLHVFKIRRIFALLQMQPIIVVIVLLKGKSNNRKNYIYFIFNHW